MDDRSASRRRRLARHTVAIAAGGLAGAAAFAGFAGADPPRMADGTPPGVPRLVEQERCTSSPTPQPGGPPTTAPHSVQQVVVTVRPTTLVRVDGDGHVVSAWTNTGCAPRAQDDIYVQAPDGSIRDGARSLVGRRWTGDFRQPGVFVEQTDRP